MALDKDILGLAIWTRVKSIHGPYSPGISAGDDAEALLYWKGIADEIIKHFIARAEIEITAFSAVAPGVTLGADSSANITGTATGIIEA